MSIPKLRKKNKEGVLYLSVFNAQFKTVTDEQAHQQKITPDENGKVNGIAFLQEQMRLRKLKREQQN